MTKNFVHFTLYLMNRTSDDCFLVHMCKMMKFPAIFFIFFEILILWVFRVVKGQKMIQNYQFQSCHALYLRNSWLFWKFYFISIDYLPLNNKKTKLSFFDFLKKEISKFISSTFERKHLKEKFTYLHITTFQYDDVFTIQCINIQHISMLRKQNNKDEKQSESRLYYFLRKVVYQ